MARLFADIDDKVVKTVGGALLVVLVLACGVAAAIAPYLSPLAWKALFLAIALILNVVLCSVQAVVLANLWEYSKDHMNYYDVEKSIRRLLLPEQLIQMLLTMVHVLNAAWSHCALQLPVALWHGYNVFVGRSPVQAVLGREDLFQKQLTRVRQEYLVKAVFYVATLVFLGLALLPLLVQLVISAEFVTRILDHFRHHSKNPVNKIVKSASSPLLAGALSKAIAGAVTGAAQSLAVPPQDTVTSRKQGNDEASSQGAEGQVAGRR